MCVYIIAYCLYSIFYFTCTVLIITWGWYKRCHWALYVLFTWDCSSYVLMLHFMNEYYDYDKDND